MVVSVGIGIGDRLFEPMTVPQYLARHYLYAIIGIAMLAPAVLGTAHGGVQRAILRNRTLIWLGVVSYGIYLWHDTVLALLSRWGFGVGRLAASLSGLAAGRAGRRRAAGRRELVRPRATGPLPPAPRPRQPAPSRAPYCRRPGCGTARGLSAWARASARWSPPMR